MPTSSGALCSNVDASARTPATCSPPLCANALRPTHAAAGSGFLFNSSSTKCAVSVSFVSRSGPIKS